MNFAEIKSLIDQDSLPGVKSIKAEGSYSVINGKIALPLHAIMPSYSTGIDLEVLDENGHLIGILCFCRGSEGVEISSLTEDKYIAYLTEVEKDDFEKPYSFKRDYFVILESRLFQYQTDYMESAPIWGGFLHADHSDRLPKLYQFATKSIKAYPGIKMPTVFHKESAARSTIEPFAFERFLKLYHLLELLFDYSLVEKIKGLAADLQGIGELLSRYSSKDFQRLKSVITQWPLDLKPLADGLSQVSRHMKNAENIFYDFGKDGNPLKEFTDLQDLISNGGFTEDSFKKIKPSGVRSFKDLTLDCTVYFIYRIRCCIAHNKIGEYVLKNSDEEFVVEFGEPLLREVLKQCLSKGNPATPVITLVTPAPAVVTPVTPTIP